MHSASLTFSCEAMSNTLTPPQSTLWPSFHACSVMADLSVWHFLQASCMVFLDPGLESMLSLSDVHLPILAEDLVDYSRSLLHGEWILHFGY